jgi:hypothetical protein
MGTMDTSLTDPEILERSPEGKGPPHLAEADCVKLIARLIRLDRILGWIGGRIIGLW